MGTKPSLTLELDSHSADAGINTRIEAALDIIRSYIQLERLGKIKQEKSDFVPMKVIEKNKKYYVKDSEGQEFSLFDDKVEVILPSMGEFSTAMMASILRGFGIHAKALPIPTMDTLKLGRANTSCGRFPVEVGIFPDSLRNLPRPAFPESRPCPRCSGLV